LVSFIAAAVLCIKKMIKSEISFKVNNLLGSVRDCFEKTKASNAFLIFYSVLSAGVLVKVLKIFIGRARPIFFEALDMVGFYLPSLDWAFNSMPSGHTTVTFAGLVMIGMLAPKYKVLTWTLAILVGFSRVAVGAHWPSDVLLGAFIGMVVADIIKWQLLKKTN
jgi:membrane-associated phospholipid phosphatase